MMPYKSKLTKLVVLISLPVMMMYLAGCQMTQLSAAAREGDVARINQLLNEGANVDEFPSGKWSATPLYWSLFNCKFDAAQLLLKKGANVNLTDSYGSSPLHLAAGCKNAEASFVATLLQKGADVNYKNPSDGLTSLHYASSSGSADVVNVLLDKNADINARDHKGTTPLMLAAKRNSLPVAKLLLERGADVNLQDKHKKTALSYAKGIFTKNKEMTLLLKNAEHGNPVSRAAVSIDKSKSPD